MVTSFFCKYQEFIQKNAARSAAFNHLSLRINQELSFQKRP